jgi:hypothetical protein
MIYGISHLTVALENENKIKNFVPKQYLNKFKYRKILNHSEKKKFFFNQNKHHDIYFYTHKKNYNIEIIVYKKNYNDAKIISLKGNIICTKVKNLSKEREFLNLFLNKDKKKFFIKSPISDSLSFFIRLQKTNNEETYYLDSTGLVSVALFCNDISELKHKLEKISQCSKVFRLKFNSINYKILLVKSPNNIIYEFLEPL